MKALTNKEIEAVTASFLREKLNCLKTLGVEVKTPPVPIAEICLEHGLSLNPQIELRLHAEKLAGMLNAIQKAIYYEARDVLGRQNFSLAHELGHFVLHWPSFKRQVESRGWRMNEGQFVDHESTFTPYFDDSNYLPSESKAFFRINGTHKVIRDKQIENEANLFAQFILLPESLVTEVTRSLFGLPYESAKQLLAQQFEVSEAAMDLRLKQLQLIPQFQHHHERKFFLDLGKANSDVQQSNDNGDLSYDVEIRPQLRLRNYVGTVDSLSSTIKEVILSFAPFNDAELNYLGATQAVELALLCDYLAAAFPDGAITSSVPTSHLHRHLVRLNLASQLRLNINSGPYLVDPQPLITGSNVVLKLTRYDNTTDIAEIASVTRNCIERFMIRVKNCDHVTHAIKQFITSIMQDSVQLGTSSHLGGNGYSAIELRPIYSQGNNLTGYCITIAVGDIGRSLLDRFVTHTDMQTTSSHEAIRLYINEHPERHRAFVEFVRAGGYIQVNALDVQYHIGKESASFLSGSTQVPGIQIAAVLTVNMDDEE